MKQEWNAEIDLRHALGSRRATDVVYRALEELAPHSPVGSVGRTIMGVSLSVKASGPRQAAGKVLTLLRGALIAAGLSQPYAIVRLALETTEELDRRLAEPTLPPLAGITEVARILGVTRQRAHQLSQTTDFPHALADLAAGPIWNRHAIDRFKNRWARRPGRPRLERFSASPRRKKPTPAQ